MSTTQPWWKRFLAPAPEIPRQATVTTGIVRVGSNLELCPTLDGRRGVKLVTITDADFERFLWNQERHRAQQAELKALPKSRRARKRKIKIVSLPPNPQNAVMETVRDAGPILQTTI